MSTKSLWFLWLISTLVLSGVLGYELFAESQKPHFLPGQTSLGHFQIELECSACHTESFADQQAIQQSCVDCHGAELDAVRDSHPRSKFTDPRNADRLARIDARYCVSCHSEHTPETTRLMGVTQPQDFCAYCHEDIADERPSHEGMGFQTCASSGCHNYHDNQALYEDFLLEHASEPALIVAGKLPLTSMEELIQVSGVSWSPYQPASGETLKQQGWQEAHEQWTSSAHGAADVGCVNCHQPDTDEAWADQPGTEVCATCHESEAKGFLAGRHGMRLAQDLPPMTPAQARLPMKENASHKELTCNSCHSPHEQNTTTAAVEACLGCHNDDHTLAFEQSPHHDTWVSFLEGGVSREEAVSCATCHLPRTEYKQFSNTIVRVDHNQNNTLRPNEKMIRTTCMHCHGLGFSLDALASEDLIQSNFTGLPATHIQSIDMALDRIEPSNTTP
ncbi:cytochrome c3 family protein [Marinobacter sp. F4216]|uniref:cytochrome c3 family protein n=1 Tax=Marinobacter sp. F4216 TaxID=2874281 RepID=UPI001CBC7B7F|nr:cytochrome c3 family protein [Marinobacter sp. F4216]MBZ2170049.1 cytochrome c3 family protein [Marinobacter sp. F4216]